MKSSTAQIASLTAFGNANLHDYQEIFDIQHSSSLHCQLIEFIEMPSNGSLKERKIIATDPNAWFTYLKENSIDHLRLRNLPIYGEFQDHISDAFVGGGAEWLIEAVNKNNEKVELWESYWKTGRAQKHNRIWKAFYIPVTQSVELPSNPSPSLESLSKIFKTALTKIEAFARRNELDFWADIFQKALDLLLDESLVDVNDDFLPNCYTQKARQLVAVCKLSSVFGGMGSWNDQWFNNEDQDKLSRNLTEELYVVVNQGLVAAVNSFPEEK